MRSLGFSFKPKEEMKERETEKLGLERALDKKRRKGRRRTKTSSSFEIGTKKEEKDETRSSGTSEAISLRDGRRSRRPDGRRKSFGFFEILDLDFFVFS